MKKLNASHVLTVLLLVAVTAVAFRRVNHEHYKKVSYYWFDAKTEWLGRQNTLANEMALTGYDESPRQPATLQEKGWAPGNVTINSQGIPTPNDTVPDKVLYSHP